MILKEKEVPFLKNNKKYNVIYVFENLPCMYLAYIEGMKNF